ncbi:MAG: hypothetical protein LQ343_007170 [Gyalolechia ehrenbergii]|nr:MAG: hypothetical protein LQ343_007170 [Gyalolechia ehrenbergii]
MKLINIRPRSLPVSIFVTPPKPQSAPHNLHRHISTSQIPPPTPFVPDSKTFLSVIGRNLSQHAAKIPTWESLFSLTSVQLRKLGVEPARTRRYLLWWRERFRKGLYGIGGDLKDVKDSVAHVRVVDMPRERSTGAYAGPDAMRKVVVNVPPDVPVSELRLRELKPVSGLKVLGARTIAGPFVEAMKGTSGSIATIKVQEGMWEQRRGQKIDGGERRKVQVRRKRKLEEIRKARA